MFDYYRLRLGLLSARETDNIDTLRDWIGGLGIPFIIVVAVATGARSVRGALTYPSFSRLPW